MTTQANVYAQALYGLAKDENCADTVLDQLSALSESFGKEPDYLRLLSAPNLSKEERCGILDSGFRGKLHPYVLNFLKLLTEKGYICHFSDCCKAYVTQHNADKGILEVRAVSAVALTDAQKAKLKEKLTAMTGKTVELACKVDPAVLGGIRLQYDGRQVDGTVQGRLETMERTLRNTVI